MSSLVIQPVADAIAAKLTALPVTPLLKAYRWAPRDLDKLPAAVIELPRIERGGPDTTENASFGLNNWLLDFPVTLYFDLAVPETTQTLAADVLEAFITAIDDDPSLGALVLDSAVTNSEAVIIDDRGRVMFAYECRLEVMIEVVDNDP